MRRTPSRCAVHLALTLGAALASACAAEAPKPAASTATPAYTASVHDLRAVVPGADLPAEASPQNANNNLDIVRHDGALYLAFRTAPNHFAGPDTRLHVVRSVDEQQWTHEATFFQATDLREPRLFSLGGQLHLLYAELGKEDADFAPKGSWHASRDATGKWSQPSPFYLPTFIPWRTRLVQQAGKLEAWLIGYTGGDKVYEIGAAGGIDLHLLRSTDGNTWQPAWGSSPVVLTSGISEADFALLDDGSAVLVGRNEAGDPRWGFGSIICRGKPGSDWTCAADKKKYDSPLLFRHGKGVFLLGRRTLLDDGTSADYDVTDPSKSMADRYLFNQAQNWLKRKRCALWQVDPDALSVRFVADLPSAGDTCFASALPLSKTDWLVYNYSSPLTDGADPTWFDGQQGPTWLYRQVLRITEP